MYIYIYSYLSFSAEIMKCFYHPGHCQVEFWF